MSPDEVRGEIRRLGPWHHDVEVAPGIRTCDPGLAGEHDDALGTPTVTRPDQATEALARHLFPSGRFDGRSVLDCGCNAGGYLFAARALGAGRAFGFDAREHWIRQARFLQAQLGDDGTRFEVTTLDRLPGLGLEPFDVTLFQGLLYHLPDPVAGLKAAADLTREVLVVNTATASGPVRGLVLNPESQTLVMSGVDRLAWLPTGADVVQELLRWCGFPHTRVTYDFEYGARRRCEVIGARDGSAFDHYDRVVPAGLVPPGLPSRPSRLRRLLGR